MLFPSEVISSIKYNPFERVDTSIEFVLFKVLRSIFPLIEYTTIFLITVFSEEINNSFETGLGKRLTMSLLKSEIERGNSLKMA